MSRITREMVARWRAERTRRAPFGYEMLSSAFFDYVAWGGAGGHLDFARLLGGLDDVGLSMTTDGLAIGGIALVEEREP